MVQGAHVRHARGQAPAACSEAVEVRREMAGGVAAPRCPVSSPMLPLPALASCPSSAALRSATGSQGQGLGSAAGADVALVFVRPTRNMGAAKPTCITSGLHNKLITGTVCITPQQQHARGDGAPTLCTDCIIA